MPRCASIGAADSALLAPSSSPPPIPQPSMPHDGDPLLFYAGAVLCAVVATQATLGLVGWRQDRVRQRRRCDASAEEFRRLVAAEAAAASARLAKRLAWDGWRPLKVSAIVDEAVGVKSFYLTEPDGMPLPRFLPGQYLTVAAPIGESGEAVSRCYSLSDRPRSEYYRLTVKHQTAPDDQPDAPLGRASTWLHRQVTVGDTIECQAPRGVFFVDPESPRPVVLIGAGVGATPILSMLAAIRHSPVEKPTYALLAFRNGEGHLLRETIETARGPRHLRVRVAYSQPREADHRGVDYDLEGRVTVERLRQELPSTNFDFYLCGPPRFMHTLVPELLAWGVADDAIHYEAFGPASVATPLSTPLTERAIGSEVRFRSIGDEPISWDGDYRSLLDLAEARGVPLASGCRAGNCGACRVRVLQGRVQPVKSTGVRVDESECLACISLPDGEVTLDA